MEKTNKGLLLATGAAFLLGMAYTAWIVVTAVTMLEVSPQAPSTIHVRLDIYQDNPEQLQADHDSDEVTQPALDWRTTQKYQVSGVAVR